MHLGSTFIVPAEPAVAFELFLDPKVMRACIPGCAELDRIDERNFRGRLLNEIAHVKFDAAFSAEILELDEPRSVRAILRGDDLRLASSLNVEAALTVEPDGPGSRVGYTMDVAMWGKLGRLGESIFRRRTAEVEEQFVAAFTRACRGELNLEPAPAADSAARGIPAGAARISFGARAKSAELARGREAAARLRRRLAAVARVLGNELPGLAAACRESWRAARD